MTDAEDGGWKMENGISRGKLSALGGPPRSSILDPPSSSFLCHVNGAGELVFIYDDDLAALLDLGTAVIARASRVEPAPSGCGWTADMSPVGGPTLGPFTLRGEALKAEREWLDERLFVRAVGANEIGESDQAAALAVVFDPEGQFECSKIIEIALTTALSEAKHDT